MFGLKGSPRNFVNIIDNPKIMDYTEVVQE
jgi:hypothetical protein